MVPTSPVGNSLKSASRILISVPSAGRPAVSGAARRSAGVAVAITRALSLTASFVVRYNSDPGENYRRRDALLVTGLQYKIE